MQAGQVDHGIQGCDGLFSYRMSKAVYLGLFTWAREGASHLVLESLNLLASILGARWGKTTKDLSIQNTDFHLKTQFHFGASLLLIVPRSKE